MNNILTMKKSFESYSRVVFSAKANPYLISTALKYADGIEVCSFGEISLVAKHTDNAAKITFGGICKENEDWELAFQYRIRRFSIESISQLLTLKKLSSKYGIEVVVLLRITSGNQFGMEIDEAIDCYNKCKNISHVKVVGLHFYPGTMRMTVPEVNADFRKLNDSLKLMKGLNFKEIEYGAGIGVDYYKNTDLGNVYEAVVDNTKRLASNYKMSYEAGRFLSADCGVYISRIAEIKHNSKRNYIVLNGGSHHFTYHNSMFNRGRNRSPQISVVRGTNSTDKNNYMIVGALCSAGDILATDINICVPQVGDYIVFHKAGSYCSTEGMALFLSRDMPAVYLIENGTLELVRPRFQLGERGCI
jgi:diaminopimelate decarboxylase